MNISPGTQYQVQLIKKKEDLQHVINNIHKVAQALEPVERYSSDFPKNYIEIMSDVYSRIKGTFTKDQSLVEDSLIELIKMVDQYNDKIESDIIKTCVKTNRKRSLLQQSYCSTGDVPEINYKEALIYRIKLIELESSYYQLGKIHELVEFENDCNEKNTKELEEITKKKADSMQKLIESREILDAARSSSIHKDLHGFANLISTAQEHLIDISKENGDIFYMEASRIFEMINNGARSIDVINHVNNILSTSGEDIPITPAPSARDLSERIRRLKENLSAPIKL